MNLILVLQVKLQSWDKDWGSWCLLNRSKLDQAARLSWYPSPVTGYGWYTSPSTLNFLVQGLGSPSLYNPVILVTLFPFWTFGLFAAVPVSPLSLSLPFPLSHMAQLRLDITTLDSTKCPFDYAFPYMYHKLSPLSYLRAVMAFALLFISFFPIHCIFNKINNKIKLRSGLLLSIYFKKVHWKEVLLTNILNVKGAPG